MLSRVLLILLALPAAALAQAGAPRPAPPTPAPIPLDEAQPPQQAPYPGYEDAPPGYYRHPPPAGQYPPSTSQYPPSTGQYPPSIGQYPAPPPSGQPQYPPAYPPQYQYPPGQQPPPYYGSPYRDPYGRPYYRPAPQATMPGAPAPGGIPPADPSQGGLPVRRLQLSTADEGARAAALACADALENYHLDVARRHCGEAIAKDDALALAHLWMAQAAASPADAAAELAKAEARAGKSSRGEQLMVEGWRAWRGGKIGDARRRYDDLCAVLDGEPRAFLVRGQLRQIGLGELDGAAADYEKAAALDDKYAAAQNLLGFALADLGKMDKAWVALRRYAQLAPSEPNAHDSLASLALRNGDLAEAIAEAKKALALDARFLVAHGTLGDALLFQGKPKEARREYALLEASDDPVLHHEGALRSARSFLFEERYAEGERALVREADGARKARRAAEAAETFIEAVRSQIERGALAEAGRGIKEALASLKPSAARPATAKEASTPPSTEAVVDEIERREVEALALEERARALAGLYERALADARADELLEKLKAAGSPHAAERVQVVKGWIAYRVGDDKAALAALEKAALPTLRFAYAQALARNGEAARARPILDELSRRTVNDIETALSRPRAAALLKTLPQPTTAAAE